MIDEKRLIEVIDKNFGHTDGASVIKQIIKEQPKVGEWIPVEDEFPKSRKSVLIYSKEGGVAEGEYDEQKGYFVQYRWNAKDIHVIAWRPLPDPYEVKGNE